MLATRRPPAIQTAEDLLLEFERSGDPVVFEQVVRRYTRMVFGVCYRVTHNEHDAEDATQAVFLKLAIQARTENGVPRVGPWLQQVARTTALDLRRSRSRRQVREQNGAADANHDGTAPDPTDEVGLDELRRMLRDEVDKLPPRYRMPLILHYFGGLTTEQMSRELNCTAKNLAVRLFRGRKMLGEQLERRGIAVGGTLLTLALVDAILATMAKSLPHLAPAAGNIAAGGAAGSGLTASSALTMSLATRVGLVIRAACGSGLTGKATLAGVILLVSGAMAGSADAVHVIPAVKDAARRVIDFADYARRLRGMGGWFRSNLPARQAAVTPPRADAVDPVDPIQPRPPMVPMAAAPDVGPRPSSPAWKPASTPGLRPAPFATSLAAGSSGSAIAQAAPQYAGDASPHPDRTTATEDLPMARPAVARSMPATSALRAMTSATSRSSAPPASTDGSFTLLTAGIPAGTDAGPYALAKTDQGTSESRAGSAASPIDGSATITGLPVGGIASTATPDPTAGMGWSTDPTAPLDGMLLPGSVDASPWLGGASGTPTTQPAANPIPEPAGLVLAAAACGLLLRRRRRVS